MYQNFLLDSIDTFILNFDKKAIHTLLTVNFFVRKKMKMKKKLII